MRCKAIRTTNRCTKLTRRKHETCCLDAGTKKGKAHGISFTDQKGAGLPVIFFG